MSLIPKVARTGTVELRETGFTSFFSVDNESHSFQANYYSEEKWRKFPDHLKRNVAELCAAVWVACIPAEVKIFGHKLSEADIELMSFLTYQTQGLYRNRMAYPSIEPRPTLKVTEGERRWDGYEVDDDDCGLYFSGGRDAFCTLGMLENAGYDPHLHMYNNDSAWDTGELTRDTFEELDRDIDTVWQNYVVLKREITKDHHVFWHLESPKFFMMWLTSLPILEQELNFFGNEATTTRFEKVGKDRILHHSWEQSQPTNYYMTRWAKESGLPLRFGSILREMGDYKIMKTLVRDYPEYDDIARSCFFVDENDDYSPCSRCHKDWRNYIARKAIGADVSMYDEEELQKYEIDPAHIQWKTLLPNDFAHTNYKRQRGYPRDECEEVEGLMFKPDRANPSYFLTKDEFRQIYSGERFWVRGSAVDSSFRWNYFGKEPDKVYDTISRWDLPQYDYNAVTKDNNSLLSI